MHLFPNLFAALLLLPAVCGQNNPGDAYDHIKNDYLGVGVRWLEVGFFNIIPDTWTTIAATYENFSDPVVFLSLPNLAGDTATEGTSMSLRVNNTKLTYINNNLKNFTFEAKSVNANDSYCSTWKDYYTPRDLRLNVSSIGWMVVERGKFNVSHKGFIIQTDRINRTNVNDSTDVVNQFKSLAQTGVCDFGKNCRFNIANEDVPILLTIGQIQTTRYDRFLLLRAISRGKRFVVYVLLPHDSFDAANYLIPSPGEDYAWMLFQEGLEVTCVENLVIETYKKNVNFIKIDLDYVNTFVIPPAVFGMVQTLVGRDSLGLRAFNIGTSSSSFITQEDKCTDAETIHENLEEAALLVIGRTVQGTTVCGALFNELEPTPAPTAVPTVDPTLEPTPLPTAAPTPVPTAQPTTAAPTAAPTSEPTANPTAEPTASPTAMPSTAPTVAPTAAPTAGPTAEPTDAPTAAPTNSPTLAPTDSPTLDPSEGPTVEPTLEPTAAPTSAPTAAPTASPTEEPTAGPTVEPSAAPTAAPTATPTPGPTAEPTVAPTAAPTAAPTPDPSALPTVAPTAAPTVEPTLAPTAVPTTATPSAEPTTASPTLEPTRAPSKQPTTRAPTSDFDWCTTVTLYDTFGDGWGRDVALRVWSDNGTIADTYLYYICPNDFAIGGANGTIYSTVNTGPFEFCVGLNEVVHYDIVDLKSPVKETWEIYWTVEHSGEDENSTSTIFVGDYDTNMTSTSAGVEVWNPVDYYDQTCKRCKHPPKPNPKGGPKGGPGDAKGGKGPAGPGGKGRGSGGSTGTESSNSSMTEGTNSTSHYSEGDDDDYDMLNSTASSSSSGGAAKPKPKPQWPFPVTLFDTTGTGWFNNSEAWTAVPLYNADDAVEWHDSRRLPAALTGPEYVIETIDRLHDVRRNAICGDLLKEDCEERLPDAKYIFRVTGALSKWDTRNNTFWHFCGKHGTAMEELEFTLVKGKCFAGKKITAHEKCYGTPTASFMGVLTISGATADLSDYDTAVLESDLAEALSGVLPNLHGFVALDSWAMSGSNVEVAFSAHFNPAQYSVDISKLGALESLAEDMTSSAQTYVSSGMFLTFLQTSLSDLPLGSDDALASTSSVSISEITYVDMGYQFAHAPKVESAYLASADLSSSHVAVLDSFQRSVLLVAAVLSGLAIVGYASIQGVRGIQAVRRRNGAELLPTESERDAGSTSIDVSDREVVPNWN